MPRSCNATREAFNRFFHAMLGEGIYLAPSAYEAGFVSAAHGPAEIDKTVQAAERYLLRFRLQQVILLNKIKYLA